MKSVIVKALVCSCVMAQVSFAGIIFQDDFSTAPLSNGWSLSGVTPDVSEIITDGTQTVLHMKQTATADAQSVGYSRTFDVASDQQYLTVLCNFRSMSDATNVRNIVLGETFGADDLSYMHSPWATDDVFVITHSAGYGAFMGGTISSDQYYWAVIEVGPTATRTMLLNNNGDVVGELSTTAITIANMAGKSVDLDMIMIPQFTGATSEVAINDLKVLNEAFTTVNVPEPATMVLLALGGLGFVRRNRRA